MIVADLTTEQPVGGISMVGSASSVAISADGRVAIAGGGDPHRGQVVALPLLGSISFLSHWTLERARP